MAEALRRRPAIAGPGNVRGIVARIGPNTVQRIHPPHGPVAESRGLGRNQRRRPAEIPQGRKRFVRGGSLGVLHCERSEEHTSELQSLMRISYAVFCLKKKKRK